MLNPLFYIRSIALALSQIWANKTRSFLTALGIIVGVASVSAVIAALSGLKSKVLDEFEAVGASRMFIFPDRPDDAPDNLYPWEEVRLKEDELKAIAMNCPSIRAISPSTDLGMNVQYGERSIAGITVKGIWPDWHKTSARSILEGRSFTMIDEENARQVCVLNEAAVEELQLSKDPSGEHILLDGRRFLVVGLVETLQASMFGMNTSSAEVFIPFSVASKLQSPRFFFMVNALIESPDLAEEAESEVRFVLRRMRGLGPEDPDTFQVAAIDQFIDQFKALAAGITAVAGGIVGISLLVGGIGIMNIMLVSVSERTREIGLRKAVGATPMAILMQFLLEAVTLSFLGGFIGLAIGRLLAWGMTRIPDANLEQADIPLWAVILAFVFSGGVGIVFGMFPAIKASRLDPIEALRHE
ncbi:MAG: ABC transporter permease [Phycisphaerales bacterium]|nr:ABC transporter permease [Phycisphaerales bacterium]